VVAIARARPVAAVMVIVVVRAVIGQRLGWHHAAGATVWQAGLGAGLLG
jgi:hypothetical protein